MIRSPVTQQQPVSKILIIELAALVVEDITFLECVDVAREVLDFGLLGLRLLGIVTSRGFLHR